MSRKLRKSKWAFVTLMLFAFVAMAATIKINAASFPYNQVQGARSVDIDSLVEVRMAALHSLVGAYETAHGVFSVKVGDIVEVTYEDGSKEKGLVKCKSSTVCVMPIEGTQESASTGGGGGGGGGGNWGGGGNTGPIGGGGGGGGGGGIVIVGPPVTENPA